MSNFWDDAEIISIYTRAEAIEDGVLVDVSETAREAGIKYPVALTIAAWEDCVAWPESNYVMQDEAGRLWDVLSMTRFASMAASKSTDRIKVQLLRVPNRPKCIKPVLTELVAVCGPGDNAEPVITIMLPGES